MFVFVGIIPIGVNMPIQQGRFYARNMAKIINAAQTFGGKHQHLKVKILE